MRTIAAFLIKKILVRAEVEGLNYDELLVASGLTRSHLDSDEPVAEQAHYRLWEEVSGRLSDRAPGFALCHADTMTIDDYGILGLVWKTSPSYQTALERAVRYQIVMTNTSAFELKGADDGMCVIFHRSGERCFGMQRANEAALAELFGVSRAVMGPQLRCARVGFQHPAPEKRELYDEWFGVPVEWDAEWDSVDFDHRTLALVPSFADAALSNFILEHLDQTREAAHELHEEVQEQARRCVIRSLPDGPPKMEDVARGMKMSSRTLHRRLEEAGCTFKSLVESVRRELALELLRTPSRPLGEVAFLTGFSEPSSFHRAFKRWTGRTAAQYRASALPNLRE